MLLPTVLIPFKIRWQAVSDGLSDGTYPIFLPDANSKVEGQMMNIAPVFGAEAAGLRSSKNQNLVAQSNEKAASSLMRGSYATFQYSVIQVKGPLGRLMYAYATTQRNLVGIATPALAQRISRGVVSMSRVRGSIDLIAVATRRFKTATGAAAEAHFVSAHEVSGNQSLVG